ncbi:MAG: TnsA endonuclease N-terminal domain-containing protein, partial [Bdellovibrio sp.]
FIQYIDPETHSVRSYYPDFIYIDAEGTYNIVEVKGDNMMDDSVVLAKKAYAEKMTEDSGMTYKMIKGSEVMDREYRKLFE